MIERYRTNAPEKCLRGLLEKHRKIWVNQIFETRGKIRLQRHYLKDLPVYFDALARSRRSLDVWDRYGGIVLQTFGHHLYNDTPPVPVLMLLECPLSLRKLELAALPAREVLVVRTPATWRLHEITTAQRFPGRLACQRFHAWMLEQAQRMDDVDAQITKALRFDDDVVALGAGSSRVGDFDRMGYAMGITPEAGPKMCWPVRFITPPFPGSMMVPIWELIRDRAPEVAGWRLVTEKMFDDTERRHWRPQISLMVRMGVLQARPVLSFLSTSMVPQIDRAEDQHQAAMDRLIDVIDLVTHWPEYPVAGVSGPLKPRRLRSPKRIAAAKAAGLLEDSDD